MVARLEAGERDTGAGQQVTCEGYGPGGVSVLVEARTADRQRTVADIRGVFAQFGGRLGADGAVAYLFNPVGQIRLSPGLDPERIMATAFELGAEDVITNGDGSIDVLTAPADMAAVRAGLARAGIHPATAGPTRRAAQGIRLAGQEARAMHDFLATLHHLDAVVQVYSNAQIGEAPR